MMSSMQLLSLLIKLVNTDTDKHKAFLTVC